MPSLSQTKKVVKVLVVSEMNIASGATDMVFTFFFFFLGGGGACSKKRPGVLLGFLDIIEPCRKTLRSRPKTHMTGWKIQHE